MSYQGYRVRTWVHGLVAVVAVAGLVGCKSPPGVRSDADALTGITFEIEFDTTVPGDEAVKITPQHGDAWLVSAKQGTSTIEWTANRAFGIKFVQIDDQSKEQRNKFSKSQKAGWNDATCDNGLCKLVLPLDEGTDKPHKKKEIRGAKYIVASPSGCSDKQNIPADCMWLDPVIIVRY
jgi:hypothetical protein